MSDKIRLDVHLCQKNMCDSRQKAQALIMSGVVYVDNQKADKCGQLIDINADVQVRGKKSPFVSRGGFKLERALDCFGVCPKGICVIDVGASTGGFTDCLLKRGASLVFSIDVGYGQLAWDLRNNERVVSMERTNIRYVTPDMLNGIVPDMAVIDVSFISLKIVLPSVYNLLCKEKGKVICLIKPQFEAGRGKLGKKGVVRDRAVHVEVLERFVENAHNSGFKVMDISHSPIKGPEGNIEFLGYLSINMQENKIIIDKVIKNAYNELNGEKL